MLALPLRWAFNSICLTFHSIPFRLLEILRYAQDDKGELLVLIS
jgi:hypothetical protein